jgi:hypothetical protein
LEEIRAARRSWLSLSRNTEKELLSEREEKRHDAADGEDEDESVVALDRAERWIVSATVALTHNGRAARAEKVRSSQRNDVDDLEEKGELSLSPFGGQQKRYAESAKRVAKSKVETCVKTKTRKGKKGSGGSGSEWRWNARWVVASACGIGRGTM